jgi:hypothetical protein
MLEAFADLSTPLVADACLRCGVPLRAAHSGIRPVVAGQGIAGRVLPVRHYGSVDVFLEAFGRAQAGDVLVIDNGGRSDEACVGDLAVLEAEVAGVAALVVWGLHRDTSVRGSLSSGTGKISVGGGGGDLGVLLRVAPVVRAVACWPAPALRDEGMPEFRSGVMAVVPCGHRWPSPGSSRST